MKTTLGVRIVACSAMLLVACSGASAQIAVYNFNQTGTSVANSGTSTEALTLANSAGVATDLHSADALGVSGQPGDRAFDNSTATAMGNIGTGGYGKTTSAIATDLGALKSFTIQGWYKTDGSVIGAGAQLVNFKNGNSGFLVNASNTGNLSLEVNGVGAYGSGSAYSAVSEWTFFAVTYDGTKATSNVKFYVGSTASSVTLAYTLNLNGGTMVLPGGTTALGIGNNYISPGRPFDGLIDDVRVFGSTTDTTGVLSLTELESIRSLDVVPEPGSAGLVIGAVSLLALFKRR